MATTAPNPAIAAIAASDDAADGGALSDSAILDIATSVDDTRIKGYGPLSLVAATPACARKDRLPVAADTTYHFSLVCFEEDAVPPQILAMDLPLSDAAKHTVAKGRRDAAAVIRGDDDRLLVV
ncbi:hypothetical protein HK405_014104, partial [Cladochytrium tenue]